jgi:cell division inhibitor SepF
MTLMDRIMGFFGVTEEEEFEEEIQPAAPPSRGKSNVVSLHAQKNIRVVLFEPRSYEDSAEIADHLKSHRPVVVNLQLVRNDQAQRIFDFLSGAVYALGGHIQKVGKGTFLCTPANVDIQGSITEMFQDERR